jgi:hypothetical protein
MSNLEAAPVELVCRGGEPAAVTTLGADVEVLAARDVGRTHDEIAAFHDAWEAQSDQFGRVEGYRGTPHRLPAPALPNTRLTPRRHS